MFEHMAENDDVVRTSRIYGEEIAGDDFDPEFRIRPRGE